MTIIDDAKKYFEKNNKQDYLPKHIIQAEKWAKRLLLKHPEADSEVVLAAIWLHDIGQSHPCEDHAVKSEEIVGNILAKNPKVTQIMHCVRAHRCKDVMPSTIEAKIVACADSASHMTDYVYIDMLQENKDALGKLERDYRDILPELKKELLPLYTKWKELIIEFKKVG